MRNQFSFRYKKNFLAIPMVFALGAAFLCAQKASAAPAKTGDGRRIVREDIEWCDVWIPHTNETALPRVLLIGDSITRAYNPEVEANLAGRAYVARLATSASIGDTALIKQVESVLGETKFDVIHFNNGIHGSGYSEAEYKKYFPELLAVFRKLAPRAKLIWATTTPLRIGENFRDFAPFTERVKARNAIAAQVVAKQKIPTDNLFALVENHPEYYSDGVHFNEAGMKAQGKQVANAIAALLPAAK